MAKTSERLQKQKQITQGLQKVILDYLMENNCSLLTAKFAMNDLEDYLYNEYVKAKSS